MVRMKVQEGNECLQGRHLLQNVWLYGNSFQFLQFNLANSLVRHTKLNLFALRDQKIVSIYYNGEHKEHTFNNQC